MPYKTYDDNPFDDYQGYDEGGSDIEKLMNKLIGQQKKIQSTLVDEDNKTRTQITQTASEIRLEVKDADDDLQSQITQNAGEIDIRVREDDVISSINLTPETIGIEASKINFVGETSFTLGDGTNGITNINGGALESIGEFSSLNLNYGFLDINNNNGYGVTLQADAFSFSNAGGEGSLYSYAPSDGTSYSLYLTSPKNLNLEASVIDFYNATITGFTVPDHSHSEYAQTDHGHGSDYVHSFYGSSLNIYVSSDNRLVVYKDGSLAGSVQLE